MKLRWGRNTIDFGDPVTITARSPRPCLACGGVIGKGERFVCLAGRDPDSGMCYVRVHPACYTDEKMAS